MMLFYRIWIELFVSLDRVGRRGLWLAITEMWRWSRAPRVLVCSSRIRGHGARRRRQNGGGRARHAAGR